MSEKLRPCPFCGHNVALIGCYKSQGFIEIYVLCPSCGHLFYEKHEYPRKAIFSLRRLLHE